MGGRRRHGHRRPGEKYCLMVKHAHTCMYGGWPGCPAWKMPRLRQILIFRCPFSAWARDDAQKRFLKYAPYNVTITMAGAQIVPATTFWAIIDGVLLFRMISLTT
jgi:hypothetical protein